MRMYHLIGKNAQQLEVTECLTFAKYSPRSLVQLYSDNQAFLLIVKDVQVSKRSKHIDIAYCFVRELWRTKRVAISFVETMDIKANELTKATDNAAFKRFI